MKNVTDRFQKPDQLGGINFYVSISHQRNHSWQGFIEWLDSGERVHFRSELELIVLMKNAVSSKQTSGDQLRDWLQTR